MNNQGRRNCGSKSQKNKESFDMIVREVNAEFSRITKRSINDLERLAEQSTDNTMKKVTMTENEAKVFIQNAMEQSKKALAELLLIGPKVFAVRKKSLGEYYSNLENCKKEIQSCEVAIKALEEVQRWHTSVVNPNIKNEFANRSTQICVNCDHKDEYIEELEAEVEEYRAIGTPEECWAAMERHQRAKNLIFDKSLMVLSCPTCGHYAQEVVDGDGSTRGNIPKYCSRCGQRLDWRANDGKID